MPRSICFFAALAWIASVLCDGGSVVAADNPKPRLEQEVLFQNGDHNYANYRIPSLVVTGFGTILALCEGRKNTGSDWDDIDLALRRSVDGGRSWTPIRFIANEGGLTMGNPCPVVDRTTGTIWLPFCRGSQPGRGNSEILLMHSNDEGHSWSEMEYARGQPEPSCDGAVIRLSDSDHFQKNRVLVSCPANPNARDHLTIRLSYDECRTWPVSKVLNPGYSGYSDLAVTADGTVLCLYETDGCAKFTLARFNIEWVTDGKDSLHPKHP